MAMLDVFKVAGSALTAQSVRLNTTASNLANAESVVGPDGQPYRGKQVVFRTTPMGEGPAQGVRVQEVVESAAPPRLVYEPNNPAADENGYVAMPNVNVVEEMVNMISASRSYQNNVEVINTARSLLQKTLTIGQ
ncbi:MAG: flagellar basal body rod protein FlgC [Tepidiphilus sp.]|jgi:flagellar basal-body rod protein FlgC|uniref:Flagellar basal-body rod protein FlgC n=1 Tax=Tepidiphilus thermophilus TaxID=876478 RepID=A0A0K6IXF0_9PROT|nr:MULTISPECIES: flagellar basal body rod protein FlgC [Tepidiphilus]MBI5780544.1 flagellar basal body rod protein FlgC [Rhodocyclales bacterium]MBP6999058.1 flagellar basal body rod protein FlgC [Tepidiphilus sp.]MDK2797625.1 flagellar basal-body rod protein FlgC [Tepidiphilus sp.]CUB07763.1 flagellar basal-body rod protein FlgC [Tepidiphilus thermophilus]